VGFHGLVGAFLQAHCFLAINESNIATEARFQVFIGTLCLQAQNCQNEAN